METVNIILPESKSSVTVELDRKKMKTCRLKVYPEQKVVLSLPRHVSDEWAKSFLTEKSKWIELKLQSFKRTVGYAATTDIKSGYSIKMLGEDMIFVLTQCEKECVYSEGKTIHICCRMPDSQDHVKRLFENWWRKQAKSILEDRVRCWYPIIEKYGVEMPIISVRKMKTLWGSCSVTRHVVTFNFYLIKARMPYIDYVVLHELVHFLYPNHSKHFYAFLSNYMPDWKERKLVLDHDVVHGV
ncbi:MAG: M48 family metallopeptidase [Lachnospiraceae bacterium]|nr:M48 family metallopeptidase [Lachnospiraceae bacterium]